MEHFWVATLCHISRSQEQKNMACDVLGKRWIMISLKICKNYFCQGSNKQQDLNEVGQILKHNSDNLR